MANYLKSLSVDVNDEEKTVVVSLFGIDDEKIHFSLVKPTALQLISALQRAVDSLEH